jgi:hypothetical protein
MGLSFTHVFISVAIVLLSLPLVNIMFGGNGDRGSRSQGPLRLLQCRYGRVQRRVLKEIVLGLDQRRGGL